MGDDFDCGDALAPVSMGFGLAMTLDKQLDYLGLGFFLFGIAAAPALLLIGMLDRWFVDYFWMINGGEPTQPTREVLETLGSLRMVLIWGVVVSVVLHVITYAIAALAMWKRRHYWACVLAAALTIMAFPIGTLLGVPAILVLLKPAAKDRFRYKHEDVPPPVPAGQ